MSVLGYFRPIIMCMTLGLSFLMPATPWASVGMPSAFRESTTEVIARTSEASPTMDRPWMVAFPADSNPLVVNISPWNPSGYFHGTCVQPASRSTVTRIIINWAASESPGGIATSNCRGANSFSFSETRRCCSIESVRGALNFSNSNFASAARAFASAVSFRSCSACFSSSAALRSASPADFPAAIPSFFASATLSSTASLYASNARSAEAVSRVCAIMEPAVVTPIAMAASAANITADISQKSHHSPLWPRNRVEAAAWALSIVSVIGGALVLSFCIIALRELRRRLPR